MADDDDFEPRLGKMRSTGGKRARRYLGRVLAAAHLAGVGRRSPRAASYSGSRHGRAAGIGRLLATRAAGHRRVIVKTSIVRLAGKGAAGARAHLRYLQRDGTTREGDPGALYDAENDIADGAAFHERGGGDRRQFRFIVSPEDGDQYDDLKTLTRRLMVQVERDLGTGLDWVAVDHFNTGHPHTHIVVRGVDDRGRDLRIARDYLSQGLRERAVELVDLDLGPPTEREIADRVRREVDREGLTSIDRTLIDERDAAGVVRASAADPAVQALRAARLNKLARLGLAERLGGDRYRLGEDLAETLRRMGERGDVIRSMQRAYTAGGIARAPADHAIFDATRDAASPLVGRVVERGLSDEQADHHYLIVDGVDGRAHFVAIGQGEDVAPIAAGSIVAITARRAGARDTDRTIAAVAAAHRGNYDTERHQADLPGTSDAFADAHVRRLEAARRAGIGVERSANGRWSIPADYLDQVERWEEGQVAKRPVEIAALSTYSLDRLVTADAATWLDRELTSDDPMPVRDSGFGREVQQSLDRRRHWLIAQGLGEEKDGVTRYRPDLVAVLRRRELLRVAGAMAREFDLPFEEAAPGEAIAGIFRRRVDLVSGRFAVVERSHDFVLVPWRPVFERAEGKTVSGIMRETGVSWTIGRGRQGPTI